MAGSSSPCCRAAAERLLTHNEIYAGIAAIVFFLCTSLVIALRFTPLWMWIFGPTGDEEDEDDED